MLHFDKDPVIAERQMEAIIFSLTAFGYIDGDFAESEKDYIRDLIAKLVEQRARDHVGPDLSAHRSTIERWTAHFQEVLDRIDGEIKELFTESVAEGETPMQFVIARLELQAFELYRRFDEDMRAELLATVDELMHADGVVHENEKRFRDQLVALLNEPITLDDLEIEPIPEGAVVIDETKLLPPRELDHPFLRRFEWNYARDREVFLQQASADLRLIGRFLKMLDGRRQQGAGRLDGARDFRDFAGTEPFIDGHVVVTPPKAGEDYELLVLGDLHGCYSCLKAALLQADFFKKVQAYHDDPANNPNMIAVFLGDYIDRGRFSYSGVLRTIMQLALSVPDHVVMLRGNHEYYVEYQGQVLAPVQPSEAMNMLRDVAPVEVFAAYMKLFEQLPNVFVFDRTIFVHAGIPRDDTFAERFRDLGSLNDSELRFQMLWSDPSEAEVIPGELQKATARFPFGIHQFKRFMSRIGCTTMIRGHEKVNEGFRIVYDEPEAVLVTLFSAGGATNEDLPPESTYRAVTPKALTIRHRDGVNVLTPFVIECEKFNDPKYNAFFKDAMSRLG